MSNGTSTGVSTNWMTALDQVAPIQGAGGMAGGAAQGAPAAAAGNAFPIVAAAQMLGDLGQIGAGIWQSQIAKEQAARTQRHKWQAIKPKAEELYEMLVYAPWMEGRLMPYNTDYSKSKRNWYEYAPTEGMQAFYTNALSRSYGMPAGVAQAFSTQAMSQLRNPGLVAAMRPTQVGAAMQINPGQTAQTMLGKQQIGMLGQRSLAQSAQRLAEYNMWRAGKVKELIG